MRLLLRAGRRLPAQAPLVAEADAGVGRGGGGGAIGRGGGILLFSEAAVRGGFGWRSGDFGGGTLLGR